MVQVLPYVPTFGEKFMAQLEETGKGLAKTFQEKQAREDLERFFNPQGEQQAPPETENAPQAAPGQAVPNAPMAGGQNLTEAQKNVIPGLSKTIPPRVNKATSALDFMDPLKMITGANLAEKAYGEKGRKTFENTVLENEKLKKKHQQAIELENIKERNRRIAAAEPDLIKLEDKLSNDEKETLRFDRINELTKPELEDQFPPSFAVGLFTKDGELRPTATAGLSDTAQEFLKLIADNAAGVKDTTGARVTDFSLASYMKRHPSLLNSASGRRKVLRDLRIINKINLLEDKGVLDIIDKAGGPGEISISQAKRRFKKENASEIEKLRKEFVNPETNLFNDLNDRDPSLYTGRKAIDEETGETYISNGKEWVLQ